MSKTCIDPFSPKRERFRLVLGAKLQTVIRKPKINRESALKVGYFAPKRPLLGYQMAVAPSFAPETRLMIFISGTSITMKGKK